MEWSRGHFLGRGSSAVVSVATSASGNVFAVKSRELSQAEFLQREQRFLSVLCSPYVVSYKGYDINSENKQLMYNLFMEYMPFGTIIDAIRGHGGLIKESIIADYTRQIVHGLDYLHSNGVVHCDIKGVNILVGESGAKIADLGCAKWVNQAAAPLGGTPMYMAPEVARGEEQGFPADIWALGCTVIEMATGGSSPWSSSNNVTDPLSLLYRIAFSGYLPEFPNFLSDQAKDFLSKCLRTDQTERWTAKELLNHPFLEESKNQNQDFITSSPTSILDQDIWNSMEEETGNRDHQVQSFSWNSAAQRIEQLACSSGEEADWIWEEETWMTIRSNGECGPVTGWVGDDMEVELEFNVSLKKEFVRGCSSNIGRCEGCSSNIVLMGWCTCVEKSVVNMERRNVSLLLDQSQFL